MSLAQYHDLVYHLYPKDHEVYILSELKLTYAFAFSVQLLQKIYITIKTACKASLLLVK